MRRWLKAGLAACLIAGGIAAAAGWWLQPVPDDAPPAASLPPLGLFTSLPLLWDEAPDAAGLLRQGDAAHWAGPALAGRYRVVALNTLEPARLKGLRALLMAQPRPLAPAENVALDDWVRGGGHLLLFADPLLTWDSRFAIGDPRRPQDVVLLSPILQHWGLRLTFDDAQPGGLRENAGSGLPVDLAGRLEVLPGPAAATCRTEAEGLIAQCRVGAGKALIVADSALLEPQESVQVVRGRAALLNGLLARAERR